MEMIEYGIHITQDRSWVHERFNFYRIPSLFCLTIFQRERGKSLIIKEQKEIEVAPRSIRGASLVAQIIEKLPATITLAGDLGDVGSIPGSRRFPGEGNGHPLQCSCLENSMDRGAWRATACGVAKSWTRLSY